MQTSSRVDSFVDSQSNEYRMKRAAPVDASGYNYEVHRARSP